MTVNTIGEQWTKQRCTRVPYRVKRDATIFREHCKNVTCSESTCFNQGRGIMARVNVLVRKCSPKRHWRAREIRLQYISYHTFKDKISVRAKYLTDPSYEIRWSALNDDQKENYISISIFLICVWNWSAEEGIHAHEHYNYLKLSLRVIWLSKDWSLRYLQF